MHDFTLTPNPDKSEKKLDDALIQSAFDVDTLQRSRSGGDTDACAESITPKLCPVNLGIK
jgi:hypothetical protein